MNVDTALGTCYYDCMNSLQIINKVNKIFNHQFDTLSVQPGDIIYNKETEDIALICVRREVPLYKEIYQYIYFAVYLNDNILGRDLGNEIHVSSTSDSTKYPFTELSKFIEGTKFPSEWRKII